MDAAKIRKAIAALRDYPERYIIETPHRHVTLVGRKRSTDLGQLLGVHGGQEIADYLLALTPEVVMEMLERIEAMDSDSPAVSEPRPLKVDGRFGTFGG